LKKLLLFATLALSINAFAQYTKLHDSKGDEI